MCNTNPNKAICQQECIPVGCVPPAAVAVSPATHAPTRHTTLPYTPSATHAPVMHSPPPIRACMPPADRMTKDCENITFPQTSVKIPAS